jgi:hypothetical protein
MWQSLFLGPYAAFPVTAEVAERLPEEEGGELVGWRSFYCHGSTTEGRAYYMPRGSAGELPKPAPREMYFGGQPGWPWEPDLAGLKPRMEIAWFKREYAAELAVVQAARGSKPTFGWGLLAWYE